MRKFVLLSVFLIATIAGSAQFAVNFTCNDCDGINHDLFTELDSGKVIVLCWVMPCGSCVGPSLTTSMVIKSVDSIHPGRVLMYLIDDYANTTCTSLKGWANSNNLKGSTTFSDASIRMMDYGSVGMPKIVVVGGSHHRVYYNADNVVNATALKDSIISALNGNPAGLSDNPGTTGSFKLFPNPSARIATAYFTLINPSEVTVRVLDVSGRPVITQFHDRMMQGENHIEVNIASLDSGVYIMVLDDGSSTATMKLVVSE